MNQQTYLGFEQDHKDRTDPTYQAGLVEDPFLDDLLHQKSHIFASKLEVLAAAMIVRVQLLRENNTRIDTDKKVTEYMLAKVNRQALYDLKEHRERTVFYQTLCRLEEERRSQAVECWRDVVMVLRDFLVVWEAHEQSQARAIFLENVGD
jgi:hypothetical protein